MRVALVKLSSLGDVIHALPVAAALHAHDPAADLVWIAERREAAILAGHPALAQVVSVDTRRWRRARGGPAVVAAAREVVALRRRLAGRRFDVAIDLQGLLKSGLLTAATRAPLRIGFAARHCREPVSVLFTNRRVAPPAAARHVVELNLALLGPLGVVAGGPPTFHLPTDAPAEARIDDFFAAVGLKARDGIVVLDPGAGRGDKRWPARCFRELAARLADEVAATPLVVHGPGELGSAIDIAEGPRRARAVVAPPTDLLELLAVLRRASVVVAADTGPLHLAAALGRPCVGLYGPTSPVRNGPWGPGHRSLAGRDGRVGAIEVETVVRAVVDLLA